MTIPDRSNTWTKSSYSANTDNCVEVNRGETVGVRDTKSRNAGALTVPAASWSAFTTAVRAR